MSGRGGDPRQVGVSVGDGEGGCVERGGRRNSGMEKDHQVGSSVEIEDWGVSSGRTTGDRGRERSEGGHR